VRVRDIALLCQPSGENAGLIGLWNYYGLVFDSLADDDLHRLAPLQNHFPLFGRDGQVIAVGRRDTLHSFLMLYAKRIIRV